MPQDNYDDECIQLAGDRLFDISDDPLVITDIDFTVIKVNKSFSTNFALAENEVIGKNYFDFMRGKEADAAQSPLIDLLSNKKYVEYESKITLANDKNGYCRIKGVSLYNEKNNLKGYLVLFSVTALAGQRNTDGTYEKNQQSPHLKNQVNKNKENDFPGSQMIDLLSFENLHENVKYKIFFQNVSDVIYLIGADLRIIDVSNSVEKALGYTPEELIGKEVGEVGFISDEGLKKVIKNVMGMLAGEVAALREYTFIAKDGSTRYGELKPAPLMQDGKIIGIIGIARDITDRVEAENALCAHEEMLRLILRTTEDFIILVDEKRNLIDVSNSVVEKMNIERQKMDVKNVFDVLPKEFSRMLSAELNQQLYDERKLRDIVLYDNEWYDIMVYPVLDRDDQLVVFVVHAHNVTETIEIEQQLTSAILEERRRIGHDLHDGLGQKLTALGFLAEVTKQKMLKNKQLDIETIDQIKKLTAESIEQAKRMAHGLVPLSLESNGFIDAVKNMTDNISSVFGVECNLNIQGDVAIHKSTTAKNLYYIINEAINNAVKHGNAGTINVDILGKENSIEIKIVNFGYSKDVETASHSNLGLRIMQYRSSILGAFFKTEKTKDGFLIYVKSPK